ncbi:hypothetical protein [Psychrobacillus sp. FJAT-21963]|uniref:hypothetical protein n=1 Tax=Psychrobacillus sp. FJAT-21963 TaxID=1712028 RepID=UPI0012E1BDE9|nr:hypothetical protein [Psychrobacillus sp. FJAT-21963]
MKSNILFVFLTSLLLITGCKPSNSVETYETKKENVIDIVDEKVLKLMTQKKSFHI